MCNVALLKFPVLWAGCAIFAAVTTAIIFLMKELIQLFPKQMNEAIAIGKAYKFQNPKRAFAHVVLTGLGGSGIGGTIVQNYAAPLMNVPFVVSKDYTLPAFVGADTLVIVSSYSGNTEETLAAMQQAMKAEATVVCITSGGKVMDIAGAKGYDCIVVPGGMPPRSCLGYSAVQVLYVLAYFGLLPAKCKAELQAAADLLGSESKAIQKKAMALALKLHGRTAVIYSAVPMEGVAVRFRQQLNENSKVLCWHHVLPEMNHNELVGWREKDDRYVAIFLRSEADAARVEMRMDICRKVIKKYTPHVVELQAKGASYWERAFYLIHFADWTSMHLAELRGEDAMEIDVLNYLKAEMGKA